MDRRKKIAVVAGGYSGEWVVSMKSALTITENLDSSIYDAYLVKIVDDKWSVELESRDVPLDKSDFSFEQNEQKISFDYAYIIIHGTPGEDGILQGYFDLMDIPYNTGDSVNMSISFDKGMTQSALAGMGFLVAKNIVLYEQDTINAELIAKKLGYPCFIKPTRSGSSIGISKVKSELELQAAVLEARKEHETVIIEEFLDGIEITCGVFRDGAGLCALPVTEIVSENDFFDYEAKYEDEKTQEITPARISTELQETCQELSKDIYTKFECQGVVRIDYMLVGEKIYVIELNTVPGMSAESIVPKQLKVAGIKVKDLLSQIIQRKLNHQLLV
ncbi:MAG: D-alanine--D-alanine ligase [Bacteroidota bacterium]